MAQRWSPHEDYIVCKYCEKITGAFSREKDLEAIQTLLVQAGFESRSIAAIKKRARDYEYLLCDRPGAFATKQEFETLRFVREEIQLSQSIDRFVKENYNPNEEIGVDLANINPNNTTEFLCTVEFKKTFPVVLERLLDIRGIKKHQDLCDRIGMSINTFAAIIRGKYPNVKKDSILQICIGLRLCTMQAEELLNSAGYTFSNAIMTDVVIKACIYHQLYDPSAIDRELKEHGAPPLFPNYKPKYYII